MWLVERRRTVSLTLAQDKRICEGSPSRRNVHRSTASEIERRKIIQPSIGVPSPVGNRAINDSSPDKSEDERGNDTAALKRAANDDHDGARAEEELVEDEDDFGEDAAGIGDGVLETEFAKVTNEGVASGGVGERIAPEPARLSETNLESILDIY